MSRSGATRHWGSKKNSMETGRLTEETAGTLEEEIQANEGRPGDGKGQSELVGAKEREELGANHLNQVRGQKLFPHSKVQKT